MSPTDIIWHQRNWSSLVRLMTYSLFGIKPLPETMLTNFQLHNQVSQEPISIKFSLDIQTFSSKKMHMKKLSEKWHPCYAVTMC